MNDDRNRSQIIRIDARNCFVESLNDAFEIGKAHFTFAYNFPQGRVTDHRINLTLYKLDKILNGDIQEIIDACIAADQAKKLSRMETEA